MIFRSVLRVRSPGNRIQISIPNLRQSQQRFISKKDLADKAKPLILDEPMEAIRNTVAQNFGGAGHNAAKPEQKFSVEKDTPDQSGKVAVITGGSDGIGFGTTFVLLKNNIKKIFVLSEDKSKMDRGLDFIAKNIGKEAADKVVWIQTDLSDIPHVAKVAKQIADQTDRLDIHIMNAGRGIMTAQLTDYGVDRHMAVNHIAHVTLTSHLLPLMKKTADDGNTVRISIQASNAHQGAPSNTKFGSLEEINQDHGPNGQYGVSKLAGILYARYLARYLTASHPQILANATHPGFVETQMSVNDIHEPFPILGYGMSVLMAPFKKDQWEGCVSQVYTSTVTDKSGEYVCPPAIPESGSSLAQDQKLGEQLMKLTREIVKEKFGAQSVEKGCPLKDY